MSEMHLRQSGFTYSTFSSFTQNKDRIQNLKKTGDSRYICQKAYFQHDMARGDLKDLWAWVTEDLNREETAETFYEKELLQTKQGLELTKKLIRKKKGINVRLCGKVTIIHLIVEYRKKDIFI